MKVKIFSAVMVMLILISLPGTAAAQVPVPNIQAQVLLSQMSPEEKVGQLFLVTFNGSDFNTESQIADLITNHHVGGVMLAARNDNFIAAPDTTLAAQQLINKLQQTEWDAAQPTERQPIPSAQYIPLFVGIAQEGGGYPNDQILSGLTVLPDQMAIGATWQPINAKRAGEVMGQELSALGFNLYLGLSLDVLENPNPSLSSDLSTRVFGGDPYWVAKMGQAYVSGLHLGSQSRMAVIARHFPGRGASDRSPEIEVATVRKSLEELKQIDLFPFFSVTGLAPSLDKTVDGLLVSHIRYQGFQGNIRATTRPVSFDQAALDAMMSLPELSIWRSSGGIVVSENLGTEAIRKFYDPNQAGFAARLVARDAFLAGNDLLYMGEIVSSDAPDNYTTILRTLDFFVQKYREDPAFAQRVDASVMRILVLKYRLYGAFALSVITPEANRFQRLGQSDAVVFDIARQSATLISPSKADFPSILPDPPLDREYMVFITDNTPARQCSTCVDVPILAQDALQNAILRLYGPQTGSLVRQSHLSSFSFLDMRLLLDNQLQTTNFSDSLGRADWIVISALDLSEGSNQVNTLRQFLTEKQELLQNKKVILFSFGAPYYMDATDIARVTAYYSLYSESNPFVEVAARLLFQEITPVGASPVSIHGIGYDLLTTLLPNATQVIPLFVEQATPGSVSQTATPEPIPPVLYKVGDSIAVRTGIVLDRNANPVPDGTVVRFILSRSESGLTQQVDALTQDGVAATVFSLDQPGFIEIRAESEPARISATIQLSISNEGSIPVIVTPTLIPAEVTQTAFEPTPANDFAENGVPITQNGYPTVLGWFIAMLAVLAGSWLFYWLGLQLADMRWAIRWGLLAFMGGLLAYNYLILSFPGSIEWLQDRDFTAFLQAIVFGQLMGFVGGWGWKLSAERAEQTKQ